MSERKKILWLVSWYPNKYDRFDGDFIQRHAKAASVHHDIHVLFIKQAEAQKAEEQIIHQEDGLTEQCIYLPKKKGLQGKLQNFRDWQRAYKEQIGELITSLQPSFIHVHIPWKAGLLALWVKKHFGLPYLITEHWGIYNKVVDDNIYTKSLLVRRLLKKIYKRSGGIYFG